MNKQEVGQLLQVFALTLALFVVVVLVCTALNLPVLNLQRLAVQHSNAYVQTKQAELMTYMEAYQKLDVEIAKYQDYPAVVKASKARQEGILDQMRQEVRLIPADAVPTSVRAFLSSH